MLLPQQATNNPIKAGKCCVMDKDERWVWRVLFEKMIQYAIRKKGRE
jgi:hypothetical protein